MGGYGEGNQMRVTAWPVAAVILAYLTFAVAAMAAPSPDPAPDPAPPSKPARSAPAPTPSPSPAPTASPTPAPDPVAGATAKGSRDGGGAAVGGAFVIDASPAGATVASIVDAVPVASRTSERVGNQTGALSPESMGLLLSLLLLGIACLPRWVLVRAGSAGVVIGSRRSMIAIVGLAIAVGALVNVLLGSAGG